jgi:aminoglycoside phosphotransferase (APT) family kinase protein
VPVPVFVDAEGGCLAYRKLPGVPMLDLPPPVRASLAARVAAQLGGLLAALHAVPPTRMASQVERDDQPLPDSLADAAADYQAIAHRIPPGSRGPIEMFLAAAPPEPAQTLVFSHNDLGIEHVLVDVATGDVTGVIDWSDAAITDPAYDFGLILRDLGPAPLDAAVAAYGRADPPFRERVVFYARCAMVEDLRYGVETGRSAYADKSVLSLPWLFAV